MYERDFIDLCVTVYATKRMIESRTLRSDCIQPSESSLLALGVASTHSQSALHRGL